MGDGGVACVPSQHIIDQFPISETYCGGKNGSKFNSKSSLKLAARKMKMKMKVKRENLGKRSESGKGELAGKSVKEVENGEIVADKAVQEEVEEGELGTLKWSRLDVVNGEFISEKPLRKFEIKSEIEMGEFSVGKWRKGEWRKGEAEKGNFSSGRFRSDDLLDKTESRSWRSSKDELENGEFVPDRWRRSEMTKDEHGHSKMHRHDFTKDKGWKYEFEFEPTGKYTSNKDFGRNGGQHIKRPFRHETNQERTPKMSSKIVDEEGSLRSELSNGKNHGREPSSANRSKRHISDSDSSDRKLQSEPDEFTSSKSRKLSDDGSRSAYPEHYSGRSSERSCKNSSSRNISTDKYASRQYESSVLSRVVHDRHNCSPRRAEKSPRDRVRYHDHRDRSPVPVRCDRSPYDRTRHYDHRNRSPSYSDRSTYDRRNRTPTFLEHSPLDHGRPSNGRETSGKSGGSEKRQSHCGNKGQKEKLNHRDSKGRELQLSSKESQDKSNVNDCNGSLEKSATYQYHKEEQSQSPNVSRTESPQVNRISEELPSMEEDMDICDTPPHVPVVADLTGGRWFYLDHFGVERGPSRLCDLKTLVNDGFLMSDHLIKHLDCDRWVTVENAVSPMLSASFPSIVSDTVTQLVSPPEAPGNLLADTGEWLQSGIQVGEQILATYPDSVSCPDEYFGEPESLEDFHIDERVGALLQGFPVIPGRELETVGEALELRLEHYEWDGWGSFEGECYDPRAYADARAVSDLASKDPMDSRSSVPALFDKENPSAYGDTDEWFCGGWSCKGGDWMRNDEAGLDKSLKRKYVLNDGYPLCQMPKSGYEDPRWKQKDELYFPSCSRRLDLPPWAFSSADESKPVVVRGVKGIMLPVIRINACVVKDHGSFVPEPCMKVKGKERYSSRSSRPHSSASDAKRSSEEGVSLSKSRNEQDSNDSWKSIASISIPKDRLCSAEDLQLHLGGWLYIDGAGHERGPLSFSEMQVLANQGIIPKHSSIYRKVDTVWVPVSTSSNASDASVKMQHENDSISSDRSGTSLVKAQVGALSESGILSSSFHRSHPQFIGYTRGKLHELVMKSYKSREFAAAINEVLEPWINARQPKKEMEKHVYNSAVNAKFQKSGKRTRLLDNANEEEFEMEDASIILKNNYLFDDICEDSAFHKAEDAGSEVKVESWGLLDGRTLARVFHFLRADIITLVYAALTCKHWRSVVMSYRDISRQVDLSSVASNCTDSMIRNIMCVYNRQKIGSLVLRGCTKITSSMLEEMLQLFPCLSSIDIRGCGQFEDLADKYPNINWFKSRVSQSKLRSLKHITENTLVVSRTYNGVDSYMDDSSGLKDYFESLDKRDSVNQLFRRNLYKRSKLYDARRSSSILSRDAHLRHLAMKKSENGYKRMQEFLALTLKDIMKENTFDFFVPKVAEIEEKMKNGYYARRGMNSIKEDIGRMCRDAIKIKNRGDSREMNRIISLFIRLATNLEGGSRFSHEITETINILKGDSPPGFCSASSKYKKNHTKVTERKYLTKSNGCSDCGDDVSDREIRRCLLKLNKKSMDSGSETSDDFDRSSEETVTDSESSVSDTESNSDVRSVVTWESKGDAYFTVDDGLDCLTEEREWGARMTKASLVPPVTRKYEVIDHYVIVADEEEVQRKMRVSLPEDYSEKLSAQNNAHDESDFPEVKDYKPRKLLGDEVIEQEVYGIDPYTHNLLLDSMPDEADWSLQDKHSFIEDVLLCTLNKQVRHFTGSGSTPMMYPLKDVVEEILETVEDYHDNRIVRLCEFILKAMDSRPDDNYVAYRKGLGVVCNKKGGFGQDDFVVEFLGEVYPAWKWFEKQDGIRSLQKDNKDPAPEFYNIYLERPKGDADGYDLVVVDAMHKANYASRICHSCKPNSEAKVTAVDGKYQIGIYTLRPIGYGEEVTFDYNSVTESKEEYEASVCLCGSQICHGSYLNLTGEGAFQMVLKEFHGILDRHQLMLEACELNSVSEEDYIDLGKAGLGSCLLGGLPNWLIAYVARLVRFINFERTKLPEEILQHNLEEKRKYLVDISLEYEKADAEVQAEGVYNQRLQNLALTINKVRYVMRCIFGDPKKAPPPLEKLSSEETVAYLWKGEASFVEELIQCMAPHLEGVMVNELRSKICDHDPTSSYDVQRELQKSLIWLRDEVRNLPCTYKSRHDAAADLIHIYAHTKCFFRVREYKTVTSPPVYISPLDLGPKYADTLGSGLHEYCKTYGENYCLGQLIFWHVQNNAEPDSALDRAIRGCLSLPDVGSFYAKIQKPSRQRVYGPRTVKFMLARMEKQPQRPWPKDWIWSFKSSPKILGSPMLDAVLHNVPLDGDMIHWLRHRPSIFQAMWDR